MPARSSFDYAVIRVVPRVEREEFLNVGVLLFCLERKFLEARVRVDESRLTVLWPDVDMDAVRRHLEAIPSICRAAPDAGPIARLSQRERFHWLTAPRSTMIQMSPVHSGMCEAPDEALGRLFQQLVTQRDQV